MSTLLERKYNTFWRDLQLSKPKGNGIFPSDSPFDFDYSSPDFIIINAVILFKRCNSRASSGRRKVDILVDSTETFHVVNDKKGRFDHYQFTKSTIRVNYLELQDDDNKGKLIESLHYDFNLDQSLSHPIFHCHIDGSLISFGKPSSSWPVVKGVLPESLERYRHVRIPTANMDLVSVMLSIMADHFNKEDFKVILDEYDRKKWCQDMPHFCHHKFLEGIRHRDSKSFRSHHWYVFENR